MARTLLNAACYIFMSALLFRTTACIDLGGDAVRGLRVAAPAPQPPRALFGEAGLAIHLAIVNLHALLSLTYVHGRFGAPNDS